MKEKTLKQYYKYDKESKTYHVDIDLDAYRDVYSEWDYSPMVNRDLDEDLIEFILECSYEIGLKRKLKIVFHIPEKMIHHEREEKSKQGMYHYFAYQIRKKKGHMFRLLKTSILYLLVGIMFLVAAVSMHKVDQLFFNTLQEGLYIGAWVALWEIFSIWFFKMSEIRTEIKHFRRLETIEISYIGK